MIRIYRRKRDINDRGGYFELVVDRLPVFVSEKISGTIFWGNSYWTFPGTLPFAVEQAQSFGIGLFYKWICRELGNYLLNDYYEKVKVKEKWSIQGFEYGSDKLGLSKRLGILFDLIIIHNFVISSFTWFLSWLGNIKLSERGSFETSMKR